MSTLQNLVNEIMDARSLIPSHRSFLTAISGIDSSGKGYFTARIVNALQNKGLRAVAINVDGWLNLPDRRFDVHNPAEHFYLHAVRFSEMFERLIFPLRDRRSLRIEADFTEETSTEYLRHVYDFEGVDVIALEGIFLLKRAFQARYDLSIWIDCSFDTALERAISLSQVRLTPEETIRAFRTIYFPAQEIHFQRDDPKAGATLIVNNDERLGPVSWTD